MELIRLPEELRNGFKRLPAFFAEGDWLEGLSLTAYHLDGSGPTLELKGDGHSWEISYREKVHFFRALGLLKERLKGGEGENPYREQMTIPEIGVMLDVSRNSVPKPEFLKGLMDRLALMGINRLILYMEDVYQLEGEPRFGYFRGGYTREELKELDDYGDQWGISLIPSIQVLGHLEKILRYPEYRGIMDSPSCLLVGEEESYRLIEKMLKTMKECFRSRMVIIGMDETYGLGQGTYRNRYGERPPMELFLEHLERVGQMMENMDLEPAYYSDMLFKFGSGEHTYLNPDMRLPRELKDRLPAAGHLIYWDYYSHDKTLLDGMMKAHVRMGKTVYAGPLLSVSSFCVHYEATFRNAAPALAAVKRHGVSMAYGCMWHDDGAECLDWLGLLGMQYYGEQAYHKDEPSMELIAKRFYYCTGLNARSFLAAGMLDNIPGQNQGNRWPPNACKYLLWQDPLMGLFDADLTELGLGKHYKETARNLELALKEEGEEGWFLKVPFALALALEKKVRLSESLLNHYKRGDRKGLCRDLKLLEELYEAVLSLRRLHRDQWFATCTPFGWERLDLRYGGLLARLDTAKMRLGQFLDGSLERISELEAPRYRYDRVGDALGKGIWKIYRNIATVSDEA